MERIKKVFFVNMHDIWFDTYKFINSKAWVCTLHTNDEIERKEYNFKLIAKTFLLDISRDLDEIFSGFEYKSAKYSINKAIRDGVSVCEVTAPKEYDQYMEFQKNFCTEKGIPMVSRAELESLTCYYALSREGEYLGACAFLESADKTTARYKYGATLHKMNANEIILWQAMKDYHAKGFQCFDFGGCIPTDDKNSYYYRHYQFKKKFGGELADSFTYFKIKGLYRPFYCIFIIFLKVFFKNDINGFINWLNQKKFIK